MMYEVYQGFSKLGFSRPGGGGAVEQDGAASGEHNVKVPVPVKELRHGEYCQLGYSGVHGSPLNCPVV